MAYYRKVIPLLTLLMLPSLSVQASNRALLHCLGQEELKIHRTHTSGPLTELNQTLVNELVSIGNIELKPKILHEVCNDSGKFSPSLKFMRAALLQGEQIFERSRYQSDPLEVLRDASIKGLMDDMPHIFFKYLSALQGLSSYSQCLYTGIPELKYFLERFHYLEEDFPVARLIADKARIENIFKGLSRLDEIFKECEGLQKRIKEATPPRVQSEP